MSGRNNTDPNRPPRRDTGDSVGDDDRGQAYTLEGIIGAMILLTAVLMALNSAVLLPSTSGEIDRGVQSDVSQQATDVLRIAAEDGSLSETLRCWDNESRAFYGSPDGRSTYNSTHPMDNSLGTMLNQTFTERFSAYTLDAEYRPNGSGSTPRPIVAEATAVQRTVTVTHTVTLYDDQTLVDCRSGSDEAPDAELSELSEERSDDDYYPIPDAAPDSHVYNVVEVRLTIIW